VRNHHRKLNLKGILFDMSQGLRREIPVAPTASPEPQDAYDHLKMTLATLESANLASGWRDR
jgi:hypothetical protein